MWTAHQAHHRPQHRTRSREDSCHAIMREITVGALQHIFRYGGRSVARHPIKLVSRWRESGQWVGGAARHTSGSSDSIFWERRQAGLESASLSDADAPGCNGGSVAFISANNGSPRAISRIAATLA